LNKLFIYIKLFGFKLARILPKPVYRFFTRVASAFFTPWHFSIESGHFKSSWLKKSVSKNGDPIPWYTYSLIDFLQHKDLSDKTVLEWGGGQSSFWWAKKAKLIVTMENNRDWFNYLQKSNQFENLKLNFIDTTDKEFSPSYTKENVAKTGVQQFDIIIIDGMERAALVEPSIEMLNEGAVIIIDDSERYDFSETFAEHGFSRIDFYGYAPGVLFPKCSSIQAKDFSVICNNNLPVYKSEKV